MVELVLVELIAVPAEQSRGRHNPRAVKRKMSTFPTKARAAPTAKGRISDAACIQIVAPEPQAVTRPAGVALEPQAVTRPAGVAQVPDAVWKAAARSGREAVWRAHIRAWRASGLSRPAFCQSRGLGLGTFNTWAARLRDTFRKAPRAIQP